MKLKINQNSYKVGVDEITGLNGTMVSLLKPVLAVIQDSIYWNDSVSIESTEYKSRDGFMAYSSNCGGVEICEVLPKCECSEFEYIDFGECYTPEDESLENHECDEHCDAKIRVWLKFEGLKDGLMHFYLYMGGGNGDAPYFRTSYEQTYFESEFSVKTLAELKRVGKIHVNKLLKLMK